MFVSPAVVGDSVIIGSCAGSVYALKRTTGEPVWQYDTAIDGPSAEFHGEPLLLGDRVVLPSDASPMAHLYAFATVSGEPQWKVPFESGIGTTPALADDRVIVVSPTAEVAAIETTTGTVVWRAMPWGPLKPGLAIPSPGHSGDRVVIADNTNRIVALNASNGETLWRTSLSGRPNTSVLAIGNDVVVGTADGYLNQLSLSSGQVINQTRLGGIPYGTLIKAGRLLLVLAGSEPSNLLAIDIASYEIRWQQRTKKEWTTYRPLVTGTTVLVGNQEKELCAFATTGEQRWCRRIGEIPRGLGLSNDGMLYVGSLRGAVQAFEMKDLERP